MRKFTIVAILFGCALLSQAQEISNTSFTNWIVNGINQTPVGWTTSNDFSVPIGPAGVSADSMGYDESPSAKIETTLIGFAAQPYPGFIVNGSMNVTGHYDVDSIFKAGEPFTARPKALKGYYKFSSEAMIEDWGHAFVILKKYNSLTSQIDTVGFGTNTMLNPSESWREFQVPITYYMDDVEPDSIVVAFFSTYPKNPLIGGKLWIDHLSLDYSNGIEDPKELEEISIFPNPASHVLNINGSTIKSLKIYNIRGQEMFSQGSVNQIDITTLPDGIYFVYVDTGKEVIQKRFVKLIR